jgi:hypothetical protein
MREFRSAFQNRSGIRPLPSMLIFFLSAPAVIYRHRFSGFVLSPAETEEERLRHVELCKTAMTCALTIVADYLHIVRLIPSLVRCLSLVS